MRVLINVLSRSKHKVIFKWINNNTEGFPVNFYVDKWLPQREILSNNSKYIRRLLKVYGKFIILIHLIIHITEHPHCKVFITHGGFHSLIETIDAEVPIIGFPVFGDQYQNLKTSQDYGIAIKSNIFTLTEELFERDLKSVLTDQK
jgi:glucuronosyltransferase